MELEKYIRGVIDQGISPSRVGVLNTLVEYIKARRAADNAVNLNFICTHNSRRSQLAQIWAQCAANYYNIDVQCFSGGTEATAFDHRAVKALQEAGFEISKSGEQNPKFEIKHPFSDKAIHAFSKTYDDASNPKEGFAAVMTCSHAEENCPFVFGAIARISLNYDDPKDFDGTEQEAEKYAERSNQIASEMLHVFKSISA